MRRAGGVALLIGIAMIPWWTARAQSSDPATVEIHDNYYSPAEIHVPEGGTVVWTDMGGTHTVTADDGVSFDSSPACIAGLNCMTTGDTFTQQFTHGPETISYHCRIHGNAMVGKVIVDPAATTTSSSTSSTSTTSTTSTTISSSLDPTGSLQSAAPSSSTQFSLPQLPSSPSRTALPQAIVRNRTEDDMRPWVLLDVALAGTTTISGVVLVRRGRVPFG